MRQTLRLLAIACAIVALLPLFASGESRSDTTATTYVLRDFSTRQEGCFEPCLCPIRALYIGGTFDLRPTGTDGEFETFVVENIDWVGSVGDRSSQRITGEGIYRFDAEHQRLVLDLQVDAGPAQRYDSRLVPVGVTFPSIDVLASVGNLFCYDQVVDVRATPLDPGYVDLSVAHYSLYWSLAPDGDSYDVVSGDLGLLRRSGGDFQVATDRCVGNDLVSPTLNDAAQPASGEGVWFLVRGTPGPTYDSGGASQVKSRVDEIAAAVWACP